VIVAPAKRRSSPSARSIATNRRWVEQWTGGQHRGATVIARSPPPQADYSC
jgi:hypothetical protein